MPLDELNSAATADPGLPDWLAGTGGASDSWVLPAGLLDMPALFADEPPAPVPAPPPSAEVLADRSPADTPPPVATATPVPAPADGWTHTRQAVPHNPADPPDLRTYRFNVSNTSRVGAFECVVEFAVPPGCRGVRASHGPKRTAAGLEWELGVLAPGGCVTLSVRVPVTAPTPVDAPAAVTIATRTVVPMLAVAAEAPAEVRGGEPVPVAVVLSNPGRVPLKAGTVVLTGPTGPVAEATLADLPAGGEASLSLTAPPQPPGSAHFRVTATAPGAPPAHATVEFVTVASPLALVLVAPPRIDVDEEFECRLAVVVPTGATVVRVELAVPDELVFRGATAGGVLSADGDRVEWHLDRPTSGTWETTARFAGFAPGRARLHATAAGPSLQDAAADTELDCVIRRGAGTTLAELMAGIALPATAHVPDVSAAPRAAEARHLIVRSARARLAVTLPSVRDVLRPLPLTALPGAPEWVAGVANVRGDIVTVIDLAAFLDLGEPGALRGLVVFRADGADPLGVLVDEVAGIRPVGADAGSPIENRLALFLAGVGADADGVVHRLDTAVLLAAVETELAGPA